jgi:CRISP-associated protein Cas1
VTRQGTYCRYHSGQVRVQDGDEVLATVPLSLVGPLVLCGAVGLSAGLRSTLLHDHIDTVFLSRGGRYLGRLSGFDGPSAQRRRRQYARSSDIEARMDLGRAVVSGKIANMRALLVRYGRREALSAVGQAVAELRAARRSVPQAHRIDELLGIEGNASRSYFNALGTLMPPWAAFTGRNRRPPRDPPNSMLSFGYSLLAGEMVAAVVVAGLDPLCGFLHTDDDGRPSLALDLIEEFRPLLVDTTVIELIRRRQMQAEGFVTEDDGGVLMDDDARRTLIAAIESRLITEFAHVPSGNRITYRRAMVLQARQVVSWIAGERDVYEPVTWR